MKRCPTCNKTFTDPNLSFCIDDGTPLVSVAAADETTVVSRSSSDGANVPPPTEVYTPRDWQAPDYQPPGFQASSTPPGGSKTWPWVVGIMAVLALGVIGIGIALALIIPGMLRTASNSSNSSPELERSADNSNLNSNSDLNSSANTNSNSNVNPTDNTNSNSNLNSNAAISESNNENSGPVDEVDEVPPPTDRDVVLAALKALEHEWTVANINADKQKLNRILADDYVGVLPDGRAQGKADYLRTIERDTTIQKWEFEDLEVTLTRDRATLVGVLRLQLTDREVAFKFTDKFVWRDGRWQAVGSQVSEIK